jgi:hypothetical protein
MEELLLHFIWHQKLFDLDSLCTTEQESVEVVYPGIPNADQGPDFLHARVKIGEQLWAGHVEIHVRSSAWYLHAHETDPHYNNVILHVVWNEDRPVTTVNGFRLPCIELEQRVDRSLLQRYHHLMNNQEWIPCAASLGQVNNIIRISWLDRMMAERMEAKTTFVFQLLERCGHHWEQVFFILLARQLGAPVNSHAMEEVCLRIPWAIIRKHGNRIDQIEALLFGTAGMLDKGTRDPYVIKLKQEYEFLKKKYQLISILGVHWKFMRMRPMHFPTIRLAQLAVIISRFIHLVDMLEEKASSVTWTKRFMVSPEPVFWNTHYHFTAISPISIKQIGMQTAGAIVINVVAPVMFLYGKLQGKPVLKDAALELLQQLPAEKNSVINQWRKLHWQADNAGQTQALLHLKKNYCDQRRCMHCAIGLKVLQ